MLSVFILYVIMLNVIMLSVLALRQYVRPCMYSNGCLLGSGVVYGGRHNIQYNDVQHNDTQHEDIQHNDTQHNDIQHKDTRHNNILKYDTQHNETHHNGTPCRVLFCWLPLCRLSQISPLNWVSLCCYDECRYAECHYAKCHGSHHSKQANLSIFYIVRTFFYWIGPWPIQPFVFILQKLGKNYPPPPHQKWTDIEQVWIL